jgi:hypothetical protein
VEVEEAPVPSSGWALCAKQKLINGANSGSTDVCKETLVVSLLATTQFWQAVYEVKKVELGAQRAGFSPSCSAAA